MNYMKDVAALLGVQLNEEFKEVAHSETTYKIMEDGLWGHYMGRWYQSACLEGFLKGILEIQKLPFKPKFEQRYWTLIMINDKPHATNDYIWTNTVCDYMAYYNGLCFRTKEEAEQNKDKLLKIINHYKED